MRNGSWLLSVVSCEFWCVSCRTTMIDVQQSIYLSESQPRLTLPDLVRMCMMHVWYTPLRRTVYYTVYGYAARPGTASDDWVAVYLYRIYARSRRSRPGEPDGLSHVGCSARRRMMALYRYNIINTGVGILRVATRTKERTHLSCLS